MRKELSRVLGIFHIMREWCMCWLNLDFKKSVVLRLKPRASCILGKCSLSEDSCPRSLSIRPIQPSTWCWPAYFKGRVYQTHGPKYLSEEVRCRNREPGFLLLPFMNSQFSITVGHLLSFPATVTVELIRINAQKASILLCCLCSSKIWHNSDFSVRKSRLMCTASHIALRYGKQIKKLSPRRRATLSLFVMGEKL